MVRLVALLFSWRRRACFARRFVLLLCIAASACVKPGPLPPKPPLVSTEPPTALPAPREDGRLPPLATPLRYSLSFTVDPRLATFSGSTRIEIGVPAKTSHVVLHGHALTIEDARALVGATAPGGPGQAARTSYRVAHGARNDSPEELVLTFDPPLAPGRATLAIRYSARFDAELSGLYKVVDGGRSYAFTQLEATDARRAFPCFDEPGFKVPFAVDVKVPKGMLAFANNPEASREEAPESTTFRFTETPPLPSYLVALAIGELDVREFPRATKPDLRLITTKGKTALGALGLEATSELVDELGKWFGIPYPYDKLDIVAVPDFAAGAMENPGLVTFREELLLLDPARASVRSRRSQARVVAHELAHQWFGNLVTAAWWDDLWLNEGFANWMEVRVVDQWKPAYGAKIDAVVSQLGVMDLDALASARAVRQPVATTSEAHEAFDGITYEKGAAVLSTIERWIGEDAFKRGVRDYLSSNAFKSVRADQLLTALDRASGKDVTQMAGTYLDRPGVPEVSAHLECDRGSRWHAEVSQEPWRPLGSKAPDDPDRVWSIPVCVLATGEKKSECADLAYGAPSLVAGRKCPAWIHPNAEGSYYRFTLSDAETLKLAGGRAQLDLPSRISLLNNAYAGVRSGKSKPGLMLKLLPIFDADPSRQVAEQVISILSAMSNVLVVDDDSRAAFQRFSLARLAKRKKDLGWLPKKDEAAGTGDDAILRRSVLWGMGDLAEDDATLREADELAVKWLTDQTTVDSDTAAIALDLASRRAGAERLTQLHAVAKSAKNREDRILALRATAGFDDAAILRKALDATLEEDIRPHEMRYVISTAMGRRTVRLMTEAWIRSRWDDLRKKLPGSLGTLLVSGAGAACTKTEVEERTAFYTPRAAEIEGATRSLAVSLEAASLCAELRAAGAASLKRELLNGDKPPKK